LPEAIITAEAHSGSFIRAAGELHKLPLPFTASAVSDLVFKQLFAYTKLRHRTYSQVRAEEASFLGCECVYGGALED
jgi:hypothetical protein